MDRPSNYEWPSHFISLTEIRNGEPLVRLSDAEAIINDLQNLVVAENQRKQQLEEERDTWKERAEFSYAQRDKQAERIKELEAVIEGFKQDQEEMIANEVKQSTALKLAREALMHDGYPCGNGCKCRACEALAAIDALGEVK